MNKLRFFLKRNRKATLLLFFLVATCGIAMADSKASREAGGKDNVPDEVLKPEKKQKAIKITPEQLLIEKLEQKIARLEKENEELKNELKRLKTR